MDANTFDPTTAIEAFKDEHHWWKIDIYWYTLAINKPVTLSLVQLKDSKNLAGWVFMDQMP